MVGSFSAGGTGATSFRREPGEGPDLLGDAARPGGVHERLGQLVGGEDGGVGERLGAAGDDGVGVAEEDLVRRLGRRLERGGAGAGGGVGRQGPRQLGAQHHLAGDQGGELGGDHLAEDQRVELGEGKTAAGHELVHHNRAQVDGREVLEVTARPDERGTEAGNHGDPWRGCAVGRSPRVVMPVLPSMGHEDPRVDS